MNAKIFTVTELRSKLQSARALHAGAKTEHERDAAARAITRLEAALKAKEGTGGPAFDWRGHIPQPPPMPRNPFSSSSFDPFGKQFQDAVNDFVKRHESKRANPAYPKAYK